MYRNKMARISSLMRMLGLVSACVTHTYAQASIPPACSSNIYCKGPLLHAVQVVRIFPDSKAFVDLKMLKSENETLEDFAEFNQKNLNPTKDQLEIFVNEHFVEGKELMPWTPNDFKSDPLFINRIQDPNFKKFAKDLVAIWPTLARKVSPEVDENPERYSLISLPNGFIIPGGRFKEIYYWDSFWIIEGIIISGMTDTARGMIENFLYLIKKFGHIPNGSRVYYTERSQPPLLTAMVSKYLAATGDIEWVKKQMPTLEKELEYWLDKKAVEIVKDGNLCHLLRYYAPSAGPRPESYAEDFANANLMSSDKLKQEFYTDIKSAAESGWDFSARWFVKPDGSNGGNLSDIHTRQIVPVDLNSMYASALQTLGDLSNQVADYRGARKWWSLARYWRDSIDSILWNNEDGVWYDYDILHEKQRRHFYPTNIAPLWAKCVDTDKLITYGPKIVKYLKSSQGLAYPGGIPTSLDRTGEQWDFPNAWPPLQSMVIQALDSSGDPEGKKMAKDLAQLWVRANYKGFKKSEEMFEKYDAENPGEFGGGGEYVVQSGFGWTNGVILELLSQFGGVIQSEESLPNQDIEQH